MKPSSILPRQASTRGFAIALAALLGLGAAADRAAAQARAAGAASHPPATDIGRATVTVDPETRRVFVVTDDETAEHVRQVINDLDRPTPQVLIRCVFLEATFTDDLDLGVDGNYRHNVVSSKVKEFSGLGTATTAFNLASSGGIYTLLGQDLQLTLAALARAGRTEILSRPSILARNNQPATISLGQQVPLITGTRFDTFGNQINTVTYQNVGINLTVTPFITTDGMVEMVLVPQISELADRSQWVPLATGGENNGAVSVPVINSRSADTVVIVPDGQTVVIGGLLQSKNLESTSKVPLLGDIPLVGLLFRHRVSTQAKTELMIFMTPHIVEHPGDLVTLTGSERDRQELAPKAFTEEDLNRFLDNLPPADPAPNQQR